MKEFSILKQEAATVPELAEARVNIEARKRELEEKDADLNQQLIDLQLTSPKGKSEKQRKLREQRLDVQEQTNACQAAMDSISDRLREAVPGELQNQVEDLKNQIKTVQAEKQERFQAFLDHVVSLLLEREEITGDGFNIPDWQWLNASPHLPYNNAARQYISQQMKERRTTPRTLTIKRRIEALNDELRNLSQKAAQAPDQTVSEILDATRASMQ